MIVVSDSSPLIALARVGCLKFLSNLYPLIHVPTEVYIEVVVAGAGLPGASEVARLPWIHVTAVADTDALRREIEETGLGPGETGVLHLARDLNADVVLIDERKARRLADVDLKKGKLTVNQFLARTRRKRGEAGTRFKFGPPKTEKSRRTIDLPAFVVDLLILNDERTREQALAGERWVNMACVPL